MKGWSDSSDLFCLSLQLKSDVVGFLFKDNLTFFISIIVGGFGFIRIPYDSGAGDVELGSLYSKKYNQFLDGSR